MAFYLTIPTAGARRAHLGRRVLVLMRIAGSALALIMVRVVDRSGKITIPDAIMGVTLLAAGFHPDRLVGRRRGAATATWPSLVDRLNIFDVLVGLPVPWVMYTAILRPIVGESLGPQWVPVQSEGLALMILTLFVMVALVITTIHLSGWVLSVRLGMMMMLLYFGFLIIAFLLIFKVIFPDCDSGTIGG